MGLTVSLLPTPIDEHKKPDLTPLINASKTIGKLLKRGDVVIYESTVYPGATEYRCCYCPRQAQSEVCPSNSCAWEFK